MNMINANTYSVISLSPNPELGEKYSFGIILSLTTDRFLIVARDISKKFGFLSKNNRLAYVALVDSLHKDVKSHDTETLKHIYGPQIVFGDKIPIRIDMKSFNVNYLLKSLFGSDKEFLLSNAIDKKPQELNDIDKVIRDAVPEFEMKIRKTVSPSNLGYSIADKSVMLNNADVEYGIVGLNRDLLLSTINLKEYEDENSIQENRIAKKTIQISKSFWFWNNNRTELQRRAKKQFKTIGVVLNGVQDEQLREWSQYINHIWKPDCDKVLTVHKEQLANILKDEVSWITK